VGEIARRSGLRNVAAGLDLDPDRFGAGLKLAPPPGLAGSELAMWAQRAVFVETFAPALAADLRPLVEDWRPDVLMRDQSEYATWVVGEALGVPVVTTTFGRLPDVDYEQRVVGDALQELRRDQGLEPDRELATLFAGPVLVPAPRSYADPSIAVLPSVSFVQPMLHDAVGEGELPRWLEELSRGPVVYLTMGNIINREHLFRPFIDALANEPVALIVTVGHANDPTEFEPLPSNIRVTQYIPNSLVFPRVDAVACHGGFNTVMGALMFGRPLVLAPVTADQPVHAERCVDLGVGRLIRADTHDPDHIRDAVTSVLDDSSYRNAAEALQHEIAALPNVETTASIVEAAALR